MRLNLTTVFLVGALACGCRGQGNDEFEDAQPELSALTMEVTGDDSAEGIGAASADWDAARQSLGSSPVTLPEYLRHTRDAVKALNDAVASVLRPVLAAIAANGRNTQVGDTRVYGPHDRGNATYKFIMKRVAPRAFAWGLIGKAKGADDSTYAPVMGGAIQVGELVRRGRGTMGADLDRLASIDSDFKGSGKLLVGFAHVLGFKVLAYGLSNFSPDVTVHDPIDAVFSGWRGPTGITRARLAVHANVADSPTEAREIVVMRARWLPGQGGRADAVATRGDVPDGHVIVANSCWDRDLNAGVSGFLLVRDCTPGRLSCTVIRTEGELKNCARGLETEELPAESPTDPALETGAPEMPAIPPSMPAAP
jgi:hypothetical protein